LRVARAGYRGGVNVLRVVPLRPLRTVPRVVPRRIPGAAYRAAAVADILIDLGGKAATTLAAHPFDAAERIVESAEREPTPDPEVPPPNHPPNPAEPPTPIFPDQPDVPPPVTPEPLVPEPGPQR